jgi:hypothetical protein
MSPVKIKENFQQARWNEPIIYEKSRPNVRGILPPKADKEIVELVGDVVSKLPDGIRRKELPNLPEVSQKHVLAHYIRLSQETLYTAICIILPYNIAKLKIGRLIGDFLPVNLLIISSAPNIFITLFIL